MNHFASPRFWQRFRQLPAEVQQLARDSYRLLRHNPRHPSLHFKKAGRFWSVRVGIHYRALAIEEDGNYVWFWIGPHGEYDAILRQG